MKVYTLLFVILSQLSLSACGPSYRTDTFYEPPKHERGKNCTFGCEQTRNACNASCKDEYDSCYREAKMQGKIDYLEAKEDWLEQRERCASKLKSQVNGDGTCGKSEPRKNQFIKTHHCRRDCDCDDTFKRCFQLCGGNIRYERRCVSGCEQK